jgi:hypothetical protein
MGDHPNGGGSENVGERVMSDEFDSLDATEKAAVEAALNRCRTLAAKIESDLRNKRPEHFVDKLALADFYASLERAADVLRQKSRQPAAAVKGPQARGRQRHG